MNGVMIFLIVFSILSTALIAPFAQYNSFDIEPIYFKKVKIKSKLLTYFIKGLGRKGYEHNDVKNYGVIYPMFLIQIFGYILSICSLILVFVLIFALKISIVIVAIVTCSILILHGVFSSIVIIICVIKTQRNE